MFHPKEMGCKKSGYHRGKVSQRRLLQQHSAGPRGRNGEQDEKWPEVAAGDIEVVPLLLALKRKDSLPQGRNNWLC